MPEKGEIQFRQQEIDAKKIVHKRIMDNLRFKKQFFVIFVAIILAAGGGLVLGSTLLADMGNCGPGHGCPGVLFLYRGRQPDCVPFQ